MNSLLRTAFNGATRIITSKPISLEKYLNIIEKYKLTFMVFGSARLDPLVKCEAVHKTTFASVKHFAFGGAVVPLFIIEKVNSFLPNGNVNNIYGCTEMGMSFAADFPNFSGIDTVGRLSNGFKVKIIDDDGNRCGIGTDGEICVKGPL